MKFLRLLVSVSSLMMLAGCVTPPDEEGPQPTRVLMIGDEFTISAMKYAPAVADSLALDFDLTSLCIGGCTFRKHLDNVKREWNEEHKPYTLTRNVRSVSKPSRKVTLTEVLDGEYEYDIIVLQQASHEAWDPATYAPYGDELVKLIREYQPQAKIFVQEPWSYTPFDRRLKGWGMDQRTMYARLRDACAGFAGRHGFGIIPTGTAVQRWRERLPVKYTDHSFGGDVVGGKSQKEEDQFKRRFDNTWTLNSDPYHLNEKGEYLQALVWIAKLFGEDVMSCEYAPEKLDDGEVRMMKEIANEFR